MDGGAYPFLPLPPPSLQRLSLAMVITTSICMNRTAGQLEGNIRNCVAGGRISVEDEGVIQGISICDLSIV